MESKIYIDRTILKNFNLTNLAHDLVLSGEKDSFERTGSGWLESTMIYAKHLKA